MLECYKYVLSKQINVSNGYWRITSYCLGINYHIHQVFNFDPLTNTMGYNIFTDCDWRVPDFLKSLSCGYVCVCAHVCVHPRGHIKITSDVLHMIG